MLALVGVLHAGEPLDRLQDLMGIPYVQDGVQDDQGRWTYLQHPERLQPGQGLNCSGFLVTACRRLQGRVPSLQALQRDRLGDSGPASSRPDWDFGWDLVFNLAEGQGPRVLGPTGSEAPRGDGHTLRGFPLEDRSTWDAVLPGLRGDRLYLASISRAPQGKVLHYHVGLVLKDSTGAVWFYHTLPHGRSHRINLSTEAGFQRFGSVFGRGKRILLVEIGTT